MIEKVLIISFIVFAINYSMKPGEIFGFLGDWFEKVLADRLHGPVFDCVVCMAPWYGSVIYWLIWHENALQWVVSVIGSMGLNVIINQLTPKDPPIMEDQEEIKMHFGR